MRNCWFEQLCIEMGRTTCYAYTQLLIVNNSFRGASWEYITQDKKTIWGTKPLLETTIVVEFPVMIVWWRRGESVEHINEWSVTRADHCNSVLSWQPVDPFIVKNCYQLIMDMYEINRRRSSGSRGRKKREEETFKSIPNLSIQECPDTEFYSLSPGDHD